MTDQSALRLAPVDAGPIDVESHFSRLWRWLDALIRAEGMAQLSHAQGKVLLGLWVHADRAGESRPSVGTLSRYAGLGRRSVQRALAELGDVGLIEQVTGGGGRLAARYRLAGLGIQEDGFPPAIRREGRHQERPRGVVAAAPGASPTTPQGRTTERPRGVTHDALTNVVVRSEHDDAPPLDLFADQDAETLLKERGVRGAGGLVQQYGPRRCLHGIAHADLMKRENRIRTTYTRVCVAAIRDGYVDERIIQEQERKQAAERQKAAEARRRASEALERERYERSRKLADAAWAAASERQQAAWMEEVAAGAPALAKLAMDGDRRMLRHAALAMLRERFGKESE